ncbi:MAG: hypothetical protein LQ350_005305 [Teloschistes chrysophthalmus]|nr:MAG: hypothetical protein LQ350_005305 [Niorma chrysophthalma]
MTKSAFSHTSAASEEPCRCNDCAARLLVWNQQVKELANSPLHRLPTEILVNIIDRIDLVNLPPFMIGAYHLLRNRTIVPSYPSRLLKQMLLSEDTAGERDDLSSASLASMPQELILAIGQTLKITEKVHLILATYRMSDEEIYIITHKSSKVPTKAK